MAVRLAIVENVIATFITNKSDIMARPACGAKMHSNCSEPEGPQANRQEVVHMNQTLASLIFFIATLEQQAESL